ncbi:MAG: DUF302 domain-containing protein [Bacteroidales bacterium]|nr:MAG: DUF302 domain-containing protein [Bacteroidales bacterium]
MKNYWIGVIIGIISGALVMGILLYRVSPGLMLKEKECRYAFDESVAQLESSVLEHSWTIPKIHDLQQSLSAFGYDVRRVKIMEICNPEYASKILQGNEERVVSSMMPCRIAVYEKEDGKVYTSFMTPSLMAGAIGGTVREVMVMAQKDLKEMIGVITKE